MNTAFNRRRENGIPAFGSMADELCEVLKKNNAGDIIANHFATIGIGVKGYYR